MTIDNKLLQTSQTYYLLNKRYQELTERLQTQTDQKHSNEELIQVCRHMLELHFAGEYEGFWCSHCERVSFPEGSDSVALSCSYTDCEVNTRGTSHITSLLDKDKDTVGYGFGVQEDSGGLWTALRLRYHPEYPKVPHKNTHYPMLEIKPRTSLVDL